MTLESKRLGALADKRSRLDDPGSSGEEALPVALAAPGVYTQVVPPRIGSYYQELVPPSC